MLVHNINLGGKKAICSNSLIDIDNLENKEDALSFFKNHIIDNRGHSSTKKCYFVEEVNYVKNGAVNIYASLQSLKAEELSESEFDSILIEESKKFVSDLRVKMLKKSRSDGSLFVLYYVHDNVDYIGLLKMDPNNGIRVNTDLTIEVVKDLLPNIGQKLHKSAFIKLQEEYTGMNTQLFVLDRQKGEDEAAKFFIEDYLNAKQISDNRTLTKDIERAVKKEYKDFINPDDFSDFSTKIKHTLASGGSFNLDEDLPSIVRPFVPAETDFEHHNKKIKADVLKIAPDAVFNFSPDPNSVRTLLFKSPGEEVYIKIKAGYDDVVKHYFEPNGDFVVRVTRDQLNVEQIR